LVGLATSSDTAAVARLRRGRTCPRAPVFDSLDILTAEEQWRAAQEKHAPRAHETLATPIDISVAKLAGARNQRSRCDLEAGEALLLHRNRAVKSA